ncbi:MAG: MBL fold metallo-hydrolase, partial [Chloroflexota bacterium]
MILKTLVVGAFASNCYIVGSEKTKEGMVIDPGDEGKEIVSAIKEMGLDIKLIVLTHAHIDHIGGIAAVKGATGAKLCVHSGDSRWVQERPLHS